MTNSYVRYASPIHVQKMLPVNTDILSLVGINSTKDHYLSVYRYSEEQYKEYKKSGTSSGMTGLLTNMLVFDFDSKTDVELARADAKEMFTRLLHAGLNEDGIQIYFSGLKGYHIVVTLNQFLDKKQTLNVIRNLAKELKTLDLQIYDEARLFRCPLSYHAKSGLYKIPLSKDALFELPLDQIKLMAKEQDIHVDQLNSWNYEVVLPKQLLEYKEIEEAQDEDFADTILSSESPDFSRKPKHITDAKFALQEGYFEPGERNHAYMVLAALYRHLGYSKEIAYNMLKATDRLHVKRCKLKNIKRETKAKEEIWNQVINPTYSDNWNGGTFSEQSDELLVKTKKRYNIKDTVSEVKPTILVELGGDNFAKYAHSFYESRILTGLDDLDKTMPICTGANVGIVGSSGSGKTSITLEILKNMKKSDAVSVFASLDMSRSRIYEKLLYKVTNGTMSREQIYQEYINGNSKKYDDLVKEMFPNVFIYSKSSPSVKELSDYLKAVEDKTGKPVRLLMIDYFERLGSEKSDDTAASKDVSSGIQDLISDFPMLTPITLLQPNKFSLSGGPDKPILNYTSIKGSSFLYQSLRNIISIWRPFSSPEMAKQGCDTFLEIAILKNDLGELDMFKYGWKGKTGTITSLPAEADATYKEFMEIKKKLEREKSGGSDNDF